MGNSTNRANAAGAANPGGLPPPVPLGQSGELKPILTEEEKQKMLRIRIATILAAAILCLIGAIGISNSSTQTMNTLMWSLYYMLPHPFALLFLMLHSPHFVRVFGILLGAAEFGVGFILTFFSFLSGYVGKGMFLVL